MAIARLTPGKRPEFDFSKGEAMTTSDNRQCQRGRIGKVIQRLARLLDTTADDARAMAKAMEAGTERGWLCDRADFFRTVANRKQKRARRLMGGLASTRRKTREG